MAFVFRGLIDKLHAIFTKIQNTGIFTIRDANETDHISEPESPVLNSIILILREVTKAIPAEMMYNCIVVQNSGLLGALKRYNSRKRLLTIAQILYLHVFSF